MNDGGDYGHGIIELADTSHLETIEVYELKTGWSLSKYTWDFDYSSY